MDDANWMSKIINGKEGEGGGWEDQGMVGGVNNIRNMIIAFVAHDVYEKS